MVKKLIAFLNDIIGEKKKNISFLNENVLHFESMQNEINEGYSVVSGLTHVQTKLQRSEKKIAYLQSLVEELEEHKEDTDLYSISLNILNRVAVEISLFVNSNGIKSYDSLKEIRYELEKVVNSKKYMITRKSIIDKFAKEEFCAIYTEDEKPCEDAFLDNIKDCCGEECTRYFIILDNNLKALEDLCVKTGVTVLMTFNETFYCPELVLNDNTKYLP